MLSRHLFSLKGVPSLGSGSTDDVLTPPVGRCETETGGLIQRFPVPWQPQWKQENLTTSEAFCTPLKYEKGSSYDNATLLPERRIWIGAHPNQNTQFGAGRLFSRKHAAVSNGNQAQLPRVLIARGPPPTRAGERCMFTGQRSWDPHAVCEFIHDPVRS